MKYIVQIFVCIIFLFIVGAVINNFSTSVRYAEAETVASNFSCASSRIYLPSVLSQTYFMGPNEVEPNNNQSDANGFLKSKQVYYGRPDTAENYDDPLLPRFDVFKIRLDKESMLKINVINHAVEGGQLILHNDKPTPAIISTRYVPPNYEIVLENVEPGLYYIVLGVDVNKEYNTEEEFSLVVEYDDSPPTSNQIPLIPTCTPTLTPIPTITPHPPILVTCDGAMPGSDVRGTYIIPFPEGKLVPNATRMTKLIPVGTPGTPIPRGQYNIGLASYDKTHEQGASRQENERWYLVLHDADRNIIVTTTPTTDLEDGDICFEFIEENRNFNIPEEVYFVSGVHLGMEGEGNDSVQPLYAIIEPYVENRAEFRTPVPSTIPDLTPFPTTTPTRTSTPTPAIGQTQPSP